MILPQKLVNIIIGTTLSIAAINTNSAQAATLIQQDSSNFNVIGDRSAFLISKNFNDFDTQLGTLTSITLQINETSTVTGICSPRQSFPPRPFCFGADFFTSGLVTGGEFGQYIGLISTRVGGWVWPSNVESTAPSNFVSSGITNEVDRFVGNGTVQVESIVDFLADNTTDTSLVVSRVSGTLSETLTYTYTPKESVPEPSPEISLLAIGILGTGLLLKKKL